MKNIELLACRDEQKIAAAITDLIAGTVSELIMRAGSTEPAISETVRAAIENAVTGVLAEEYRMTVRDLLKNKSFDVNANVKVYAGGHWAEDGTLAAIFSCGTTKIAWPKALDSHITYMTTDDEGTIIIECDAKMD